MTRSRRPWSGPCGTVCSMTDHKGGLRGNLAGPARAMVRNHLGEAVAKDKRRLKRIEPPRMPSRCHTTGIERPWRVERLPRHISKPHLEDGGIHRMRWWTGLDSNIRAFRMTDCDSSLPGRSPGRQGYGGARPVSGLPAPVPPRSPRRREGRGMAGPGRCQDSLASVSDRYR